MTRTSASLNLDQAVFQDFRQAVFERHGKLYGCMRREATKALEDRIRLLREEARSP